MLCIGEKIAFTTEATVSAYRALTGCLPLGPLPCTVPELQAQLEQAAQYWEQSPDHGPGVAELADLARNFIANTPVAEPGIFTEELPPSAASKPQTEAAFFLEAARDLQEFREGLRTQPTASVSSQPRTEAEAEQARLDERDKIKP